jgi:hypothetical protein
LWAAAAAVQGVPKAAIDTNRLFAANLSQVPLIFAVSGMDQALRQRLAGIPVEWSSETLEGVLDFLGRHTREPHPKAIDCETGSAAFPRCYWLEITEFDFTRRNDVLKVSRILPGSGAFLDAGPFGYDAGDPGPGLTIAMLPEGYKGPLKMGDRIVGVAGQRVGSAADYIRLMDQLTEEKPAALMVERGKQRLRIESRIRLPRREETVTARVRAEFQAETHDLLVVSRGVSSFRFVSVDPWTGATVNWNGRELGKVPGAGCWIAGSGAGLLPCPTQ